MKIISRYFSREFFKFFALCQTIFVAIYLIIDFVQKVDNFLSNEASLGAAIIYFILTPLIKSISLNPNPDFYQGRVNLSINMGPLIVMVVLLLYYILFSIFYIGRHGIKKATGISKRKMTIFQVGFPALFALPQTTYVLQF